MKQFIIIISIIIFSSCKKDFLEVIDKTTLLKQGYIVDLKSTSEYLQGIYIFIDTKVASGAHYSQPEFMADNVKPGPDALSDGFDVFYTWNQSPTSKSEGTWLYGYKVVRDCNFVMEKAEEFKSENTDMADAMTAQALALRAWMHFWIVNAYAQSYNYTTDASHIGVPYILTSSRKEILSRSTVANVYDHIIEDLKRALELFKDNKSVTDRLVMNYQAAKALLSRVYLFKNEYNSAKDLALQVLSETPLMTSDYPGSLYTENESEALFQVAPGPSANNKQGTAFIGLYSKLYAYLLATNDVANLYRSYPADKRNSWVEDSPSGILINKFNESDPSDPGSYYQTIFRSTEMVLTAAESYAMMNNDDSARYFINQIRSRADIPLLDITITGTALTDSIRIERRKEMAFDGVRLFDLFRWKQGVNRIDAAVLSAQSLPYGAFNAVAPLPFDDVFYGGLQQNLGY
jgi:starch-binding outer membrane protein, SusD/RagB family